MSFPVISYYCKVISFKIVNSLKGLFKLAKDAMVDKTFLIIQSFHFNGYSIKTVYTELFGTM